MAYDHLQFEETGSEVIVFDSKAQQFHFLNEAAYTIIKACNGCNTIRDIAVMLTVKFNREDFDAVLADVADAIAQLREAKLILFIVDDLRYQSAPESLTESPLLAVSLAGSSMFPVLLPGDKALIKKCPIEELKEGDVIVCPHPLGRFIAHRILALDVSPTGTLIITKGDMCLDPDPPVEVNRVLGKVVAVLREGGVQWMAELDREKGGPANKDDERRQATEPPTASSQPEQRPFYRRLQVLDLRDVSVEAIRNIEFVEEVSLVLLSPENAHAWQGVSARDTKTVLTVPANYGVYTGQPELLPELLEFISAPLRLVISGQLFLTTFEPSQIGEAIGSLILNGQAYVRCDESRAALESVTKIVSGGICVVPQEHSRWIGQSVLGPEYLDRCAQQPLVAVGELVISERMAGPLDDFRLFTMDSGKNYKTKAGG